MRGTSDSVGRGERRRAWAVAAPPAAGTRAAPASAGPSATDQHNEAEQTNSRVDEGGGPHACPGEQHQPCAVSRVYAPAVEPDESLGADRGDASASTRNGQAPLH